MRGGVAAASVGSWPRCIGEVGRTRQERSGGRERVLAEVFEGVVTAFEQLCARRRDTLGCARRARLLGGSSRGLETRDATRPARLHRAPSAGWEGLGG